jgi:hypothetical protein
MLPWDSAERAAKEDQWAREWDADHKVTEEAKVKTINVSYTVEKSQGAASHGYNEFDWQGYTNVTEDGTERDLNPEELEKFKAIDAELSAELWSSGGEFGEFHARIGYDDVKAADIDDYKEAQTERCANRVEEVIKKHLTGYEVEVNEA